MQKSQYQLMIFLKVCRCLVAVILFVSYIVRQLRIQFLTYVNLGIVLIDLMVVQFYPTNSCQ